MTDTSLPWSDPDSEPLEDIRRYVVATLGDDIARLGTWGMMAIWFKNPDGTLMDVKEGLTRYGWTLN